MKKNDLFAHNGSIYRVLQIKENNILIVDCVKMTMPQWKEEKDFMQVEILSEEELRKKLDVSFDAVGEDSSNKKTMNERFALIAGILPFIGDIALRNSAIETIANEYNVSKQTIRRWLGKYLALQDKRALLPQIRKHKRSCCFGQRKNIFFLQKQ